MVSGNNEQITCPIVQLCHSLPPLFSLTSISIPLPPVTSKRRSFKPQGSFPPTLRNFSFPASWISAFLIFPLFLTHQESCDVWGITKWRKSGVWAAVGETECSWRGGEGRGLGGLPSNSFAWEHGCQGDCASSSCCSDQSWATKDGGPAARHRVQLSSPKLSSPVPHHHPTHMQSLSPSLTRQGGVDSSPFDSRIAGEGLLYA